MSVGKETAMESVSQMDPAAFSNQRLRKRLMSASRTLCAGHLIRTIFFNATLSAVLS
jgi:hypothetical protein